MEETGLKLQVGQENSSEDSEKDHSRSRGTENQTQAVDKLELIDPSLIVQVNQALSSMDTRLGELVKQNAGASKLWPWALKTFVVSIPTIFAFVLLYGQYVSSSNESRYAATETQMRLAIEQLESEAALVKTDGLRVLYNVAFSEHPLSSSAGFFAPFANLRNWAAGQTERPFYKPATNHVAAFLARHRDAADKELLSSALLEISVDWVRREKELEAEQRLGSAEDSKNHSLLSGAQLPFARLLSRPLTGIDLSGANLSSSNLSYSDLSRARLDRTDFSDSQLVSTTFIRATLRSASFSGANLSFSHLQNVEASGKETDFSGANLAQADLSGANFRKARLASVVFRNAILVRSNFEEANLQGAEFTQANLADANFSRADLRGADLRYAREIEKVASWSAALIEGARFSEDWEEKIRERTREVQSD